MSAVTEKYGWVGDHGERTPEPTYEPDMAALLDGESEADTRDDLAACAEVMRGVFALVFAQREGTNAPVKLDLAFRRLSASHGSCAPNSSAIFRWPSSRRTCTSREQR